MNLPEGQVKYKPDAGKHPEDEIIYCGLCGSEMVVGRGIVGSRSYVESMGGIQSTYDEYTCPHIKTKWHMQVKALKDEAKKTPSAVMATLYQNEANAIMQTQINTKESWEGLIWY